MTETNEKKVVVKTQLTGKMMAEFDTVRLLRLWWFFVPIGVLFLFFAVMLFIFPEDPEDKMTAVIVAVMGLVFGGGIFLLPKALTKLEPQEKYIQPNDITLTFYKDKLNVDVSGGEQGEMFITYQNKLYNKACKFRRDYRNEDWQYENIRTCFESKKCFCFRLTFSDVIIFYKSQIVEGDVGQLKEILKEKMGKRYKGKRS